MQYKIECLCRKQAFIKSFYHYSDSSDNQISL